MIGICHPTPLSNFTSSELLMINEENVG
jgi:hypothetical protein